MDAKAMKMISRNNETAPDGALKAGLVARVGRIVHLLASVVLILGLAYVLGRSLLVERIGNDGPHQLSYAEWLSHYFPKVPNWFPLAGGGYSVRRAYPVLPELLIAAASHWTGMSTLEWFHISAFLSVVITAIGIYLFCWSAFKNQTIGLVASGLYLLSPVSWFFIWEHGFITTVMALAFLPFTLLTFERYFTGLLAGSKDPKHRAWYVLSVVLLSLTMLMHVVVGAAAAAWMLLYGILTVVSSKAGRRVRAAQLSARAILATGIAAGLLLIFWLVPLYSYLRFSGGDLGSTGGPEQQVQSLLEMTSLTSPETQHWARNASFPTGFVGLCLLGVLLSWPLSRKQFSASAIGITALFAAATAAIKVAFSYLGPFSNAFSLRSMLLVATLFIPIGAAVGSWAIATIVAYPIQLLVRVIPSKAGRLRGRLAGSFPVLVSIMALLVAGSVAFAFRSLSSLDPQYLNYGIDRLRGVNLDDVWGTGEEQGSLWDQLRPGSWPAFFVAGEDEGVDEALRVLSLLPEDRQVRIDISPYIGRLAQNMVVYSGNSQLAVYTASAELIQSMHGYYTGVFFGREPRGAEFGRPDALNELAMWSGTEYVYLNADWDQSELYDAAGWERIAQDQFGGFPIELWRFPGSTSLATLSSRPSILVIGKPDVGAYELVFRLATRGAVSYDEAWMVEGDLPVDGYSLDELQRFDAVFLQGYTYNDRARAWNLLERYVRQGGALYVDTGWQWTVPDWESDPAPEVLPVARMTWTNYGTTNDYSLEAPEISGDIDASQFASLTWDGQPWGVSGMSRAEVREWGQVVLSAAGNPLIVAGRFGDGRVIWSGMNLVGHAYDKDNQAEVRLLHSLIAWLTADNAAGDYAIAVTREDPDRVEFRASLSATQRTTLYWREAYYPAWHAYLVSTDGDRQRLPIYRGGPGFMLISIPASSGNLDIVLEWETPLVERLAAILSILTLGALCGFVADGLFLQGRVTSGIRDRLNLRRRRDKPRGRVEWLESSKSEEADLRPSASGSGLHTSPDQPTPKGAAPGTRDEDQIGLLWEKYVSSVEQDKQRNAQAEGMIRRRRRSRSHGDESENSR